MKFGKLQDISAVRFSLPSDPAANQRHLPGSPTEPAFYIGCTGWSMKEWVGKVYPPSTKAAGFLRAYSQQFNTIELNTTHYRIPDAATVDKWKQETTPDFRFCPKVPQSISHSRDLGLGSDLIPAFAKAIGRLGEKLGCCFLQLPPYFGTDRAELLSTFLKAFPAAIPLAVEARHESWFSAPQQTNAFLELLARQQRSAVITDVAGRRDVLHMGLAGPTTMVRFVGNGLHPTDYSRADEWIARLKRWAQRGLSQVYFFPHEPDNILAPEMAAYLYEKIKKDWPGADSRGPVLHQPPGPQPEQMSLF
ncbi:DUF72 domain-containing protein [Phaeodactylibacter luteus]|uniref:DUF72 domain-containing protein n=1 Tax=Phaeodactylibacter luteus TaxID=1564516 RepID=A0A5C6S5X4_9BACT|nr:DUF72 domain-containing protein [Phaeodactylibacter luteus]TXB70248.1 DUF72 domain-containing protein [Phaeodactylibacter luteus]